MKKLALSLTIVISSLLASSAMADSAVETIVSLGAPTNSSCALVQVPALNFNAGGYLAIDISTPGGKAMLSTAMLAFAMGKKIWVNRIQQPAGCYGLVDYAGDLRISN